MTPYEHQVLTAIALNRSPVSGDPEALEEALAALTKAKYLGGSGGVTARGMLAVLTSEQSLLLMYLSQPNQVFDLDSAQRLRVLGLVRSRRGETLWMRTPKGETVIRFMLDQAKSGAAA